MAEVNATETTSLLRRDPSCNNVGIRSGRSSCFGINSKAALLTLFWCFCIGMVYGLTSNPSILQFLGPYAPFIYFGNAISFCFYPLSGHIADNVVGRYKMIIGSLKLLIVAFLMVVLPLTLFASLLICRLVNPLEDSNTKDYIETAGKYGLIVVAIFLYLVMNIGFVGFNANVIQFGMEQLHDSPADHQILFIYRYVWIYYIVQCISAQPWNMLSLAQDTYNNSTDILIGVAISLFTLLGLASLVMTAASLFIAVHNKNWFLINPSRVSPHKLVYKITRFARKHKVPIRRSAFTYCEDEIPTGLDLAKDKYGGPYTTEEVENVKAFYGILKILLSLGPVFFLMYGADPALYWMTGNIYYKDNTVVNTYSVYIYLLDGNTVCSIVVITLISFHLAVLRRMQCRYSPNLLKTIGFGIIFLIFSLISITVTASSTYADKLKCSFNRYSYNSTQYGEICLIDDVILPAFPRFLYGVSNVLLYPALYAFICAQSPPSMKGLLIGFSFAIKGIFQVIGAAFVLILLANRFSSYLNLGYYGVNIVWAIFSLTLYSYFARTYQYRKRDDICDIYRYAEDYYSNTQEENNYN